MARYAVVLTPAAARALKRIREASVQRRLVDAMEALADQPRPLGAKRLKGAEGVLRIRVGDYRILYTIDAAVLTVLVVMIGDRKEVYR